MTTCFELNWKKTWGHRRRRTVKNDEQVKMGIQKRMIHSGSGNHGSLPVWGHAQGKAGSMIIQLETK